MILKVADPKEIYSVLDKSYLLEPVPHLENNDWKVNESKEELEMMIKTAEYNLHTIELPHPLNGITMELDRSGSYYSGKARLTVRNLKAYRSLSARLAGDLAEIGMTFLPTTAYGSGHICDKNKIPIFSIMESVGDSRIIGMGVYGSIPKKFGDFENFKKDIISFEKIINTYILNCLNPNLKSLSPMQDITLYFV
jgi:hypothetical protein